VAVAVQQQTGQEHQADPVAVAMGKTVQHQHKTGPQILAVVAVESMELAELDLAEAVL
jgi:hypothetical protein